MKEVFSYVDSREIEGYQHDFYYLEKVRMMAIGKGEEIQHYHVMYCDHVDLLKSEITFYTYVKADVQFHFFLDGEEVVPLYRKQTPLKCWGQTWGYEVSMIVPYQKESQILTAKIRGRWCHLYDFHTPHCRQLSIESIYCLQRSKECARNNKRDLDLWLLMDRDTQADDNAEHLYRHIRRHHPEKNVKFVLSRSSPHWKRLSKEGFDLIPYSGKRHKTLMSVSSKLISSHGVLYKRLHMVDIEKQQINLQMDFVFLNHGVDKSDMSHIWNNAGLLTCGNRRRIALFITVTPNEFASTVDGSYKVFPFQVKLTGYARHDMLLSKKMLKHAKTIIVMPTWRRTFSDGESWHNSVDQENRETFLTSDYAKVWKQFFCSLQLQKLLARYNYRMILYPHPNVVPFLKYWNIPQYITCETIVTKSIQEVFIESVLMITDYSSVAFEMAYIEKPVIYYQFDEEEFYLKHYKKSYFDYRRDGFGPVVTTEEDLLRKLENLLKRNCRPESRYLQRMQTTFPFRDGMCCERIYQAVCDLDKPRKLDDFDRDLLMEYAEHAECCMDLDFARNCWQKLYSCGDSAQKLFADKHFTFVDALSAPLSLIMMPLS
jgi:CDP-glycerol glycerophosphotransferase (TagB/SpsB family)